MDYNSVIGLEVHSQLMTESKMFCNCKANYQDSSPNTTVCEVCMGMPGVLPVVNRKAIEFVIATGLALGCTIAESTLGLGVKAVDGIFIIILASAIKPIKIEILPYFFDPGFAVILSATSF